MRNQTPPVLSSANRRKYIFFFATTLVALIALIVLSLSISIIFRNFSAKDNTINNVNESDFKTSQPRNIISDNTVTLVGGKSVCVTVELSDGIVGIGQEAGIFSDGYAAEWDGTFLIRVSTTDNQSTQETISLYPIPTQDFDRETLRFTDTFAITFSDYNDDGSPDFTLGQQYDKRYQIYNKFNLYSIDEKGKVSRLDTDGMINACEETPSFSLFHKNGLFCTDNEDLCVYKWNKDKFVLTKFSEYSSFAINEYSLTDCRLLLDEYNYLCFDNATFVPEASSKNRFRLSIDFSNSVIDIYIEKYEFRPLPPEGQPPGDTIGPAISFAYHYDTNTITDVMSMDWEENGLSLSNQRMLEISQDIKKILELSLKQYNLETLMQ